MKNRTAWIIAAALAVVGTGTGVDHRGQASPAPENLVWEPTGGPLGGLGYDIRVNFAPQLRNEWYVTDAWAGLHISTDYGLTWFPSNNGIDTRVGAGAADAIPVFCATVDPHDTRIIWAGTQNSGDIFKSTDRGRSWSKKINGIEPDPQKRIYYSFRGFTVDPRTSDIVYAMAEIASMGWTPDGSARKGLELDMTMGVVYKTVDGGDNWREIWRGNNLARYCWINPQNPDVLYVSTGIFDREAANTDVQNGYAGGVGILKSTDGGETWQVQDQDNGLADLYVSSLFMHPTNPDILLAAAAHNNWSGYFGQENFTGGVFRTEDGGETWRRVTSEAEPFSAVEFSISDPRIAYAGSSRAIYRSEDGGITWMRFGRADGTWGSPGVIGGFPIDMQCDLTNTMRVFVNNYLGGNFLSTDGGETWQSASKGYTGSFIYSIAPFGKSGLYAAGRPGIFHTADAGDTWTGLSNPDSVISGTAMNEVTALAAHPLRPERIVAAPTGIGSVIYTENSGRLWHRAEGIPLPLKLVSVPTKKTRFFAAVTEFMIFDFLGLPQNWAQFEEPENGVYISNDSGASWAKVSGTEISGTAVSTIAVHPYDADVIYAARVSSQGAALLRSTDAGAHWVTIGSGLPTGLGIRSLAINPSDTNIMFAGIHGGGIYRSMDGGLSFVQSSSGLNPEAIITSVEIQHKSSGSPQKNRIFAGDYRNGVYLSEDGGMTWRSLSAGLEHKTVNTLAISPDGSTIYASIQGAGIYRMKLK